MTYDDLWWTGSYCCDLLKKQPSGQFTSNKPECVCYLYVCPRMPVSEQTWTPTTKKKTTINLQDVVMCVCVSSCCFPLLDV